MSQSPFSGRVILRHKIDCRVIPKESQSPFSGRVILRIALDKDYYGVSKCHKALLAGG